jgi:hypothetical protein
MESALPIYSLEIILTSFPPDYTPSPQPQKPLNPRHDAPAPVFSFDNLKRLQAFHTGQNVPLALLFFGGLKGLLPGFFDLLFGLGVCAVVTLEACTDAPLEVSAVARVEFDEQGAASRDVGVLQDEVADSIFVGGEVVGCGHMR